MPHFTLHPIEFVAGLKRNQIMSQNQRLPEIPDTWTVKMITIADRVGDTEVGGMIATRTLMKTRNLQFLQDTRTTMNIPQRKGKERKRKVSS